MSARRAAAKASVQETAPARTSKQSSGGGSKVIPRKRAHEQAESKPETASDKSTPVAALRDDDTLLRVKQGSPSKRLKDDTPSSVQPSESRPQDSEEEDPLDTTASQQQVSLISHLISLESSEPDQAQP